MRDIVVQTAVFVLCIVLISCGRSSTCPRPKFDHVDSQTRNAVDSSPKTKARRAVVSNMGDSKHSSRRLASMLFSPKAVGFNAAKGLLATVLDGTVTVLKLQKLSVSRSVVIKDMNKRGKVYFSPDLSRVFFFPYLFNPQKAVYDEHPQLVAYNLASGRRAYRVNFKSDTRLFTIGSDGRMLAVLLPGNTIRIASADTGAAVTDIKALNSPNIASKPRFQLLRFIEKDKTLVGLYVSLSAGSAIHVWNIRTGKLKNVIRLPLVNKIDVCSYALNAKSDILAVQCKARIYRFRLNIHTGRISSIPSVALHGSVKNPALKMLYVRDVLIVLRKVGVELFSGRRKVVHRRIAVNVDRGEANGRLGIVVLWRDLQRVHIFKISKTGLWEKKF